MNKQNSKSNNNSAVILYLLPLIVASPLTYFLYEDIFAILFVVLILFALYTMMYLYFLNKFFKQ